MEVGGGSIVRKNTWRMFRLLGAVISWHYIIWVGDRYRLIIDIISVMLD
jgi:hypothetical protein